MLTDKFKLLLKSKHKLLDIWSYFLGEFRFNFPKLTRKYIREQISFRIKVMKKECIMNGACLECGCDIPQLAYCNKPCEGDCYPPIMNKAEWDVWKKYNFHIDKNGNYWSFFSTMSTNKNTNEILSQGFIIIKTTYPNELE